MADNKEMKTLGGYEIVDEKAREEIHVVEEKADEAYSLAKGATKAFVYDTYEDMISELNTLGKEELLVNYHIMIRTVCVPDLWISGVSDEHVEYTYTSNEDFIVDLTEDGVVQVGYFVLSALETQKVELDDYVKKTDYAGNNNQVGVVSLNGVFGISSFNNSTYKNALTIQPSTKTDIDKKGSLYKPIVPYYLDYAVKKALSDCKLSGDDAWTEEEKASALETLGGVASSNVSQTVQGLKAVQRLNGGGILVPIAPTGDSHATSKKYVDDLVGSVESILTELHTYAETKIGGEA